MTTISLIRVTNSSTNSFTLLLCNSDENIIKKLDEVIWEEYRDFICWDDDYDGVKNYYKDSYSPLVMLLNKKVINFKQTSFLLLDTVDV